LTKIKKSHALFQKGFIDPLVEVSAQQSENMEHLLDWSDIRYAQIAALRSGGMKASRTCLDPQRGHFRRVSSPAGGKSRPPVQTSV
jgi:hypothetical protein